MEALSGVSSAFAVASLAIQAADSVKKLSRFWDSVQDAPQSVSDIIEDLGIVSNALEDIAYDANSARPHSRSLELSLSSLHICSDKVQRLQILLEELSLGLSAAKRRKRTWASFKAAWIQDKISKFQDSVRDLKTTLVITRQTAISRFIIANQESQQLELALIADGIKSLLKQQKQRTVTTVSEHNLDLRKEIDNLASTHGDSMSNLGMGKSMDMAISQLSKMFAAQFGHAEVCKLLIAEGADVEAQNFMKDSVASYACLRASDNTTSTSCNDHIQTLRLFLNFLEFDEDMNCSGLTGLRRLVTKRCSDPNCQHPALHPAALYWALPILKTQFSRHMSSIDRTVANLWQISILEKDHEALKRLVTLVGNADFQRILKWFSPLHFVTWNIYEHIPARRESLRVLITNGLDLHYLADERLSANFNYNTIRDNTPTSLAMRSSLTFFHFRDILFQCSIQLSTFIEHELQRGPLANMGWTPPTLQRLFELDFKPADIPTFTCTRCKYPSRSSTEKTWQIFLEKVIEGGDGINAIKVFGEAEEASAEGLEGICWYCESQGVVPEQENPTEESAFLLSI
ncbi:hypothetical protein B0O99DRAFT_745104 [Bisporella sp. PMI_857]|nr:hypothetical protein B0O99DRAFT_745104 [Bisporella sp. PMI_857]